MSFDRQAGVFLSSSYRPQVAPVLVHRWAGFRLACPLSSSTISSCDFTWHTSISTSVKQRAGIAPAINRMESRPLRIPLHCCRFLGHVLRPYCACHCPRRRCAFTFERLMQHPSMLHELLPQRSPADRPRLACRLFFPARSDGVRKAFASKLPAALSAAESGELHVNAGGVAPTGGES